MMAVDTKKVSEGREVIPVAPSRACTAKVEKSALPVLPAGGIPEPEVSAKAARRRFTAQYKLDILKQADACSEPGTLGALLRREGLYSSYLKTWRSQMNRGTLAALAPKKRGRKESSRNPLLEENEMLRKENKLLVKRLEQAEMIIDVQKKISMLLSNPQETIKEGMNG